MKIGLLILVSMFVLSGCGDETTTNSTTVVQGDNGVYISNGDGTVTYVADAYNEGDKSDGTGEYDDQADEEECKADGFFWCPLTKTCNNVSGSSGSCTK